LIRRRVVARSKPRNSGETPTRSIRVSDRVWAKWKMAAELAGTDRNKFIVKVTNNAAHIILEAARYEEQDAEEPTDG
jgi:uncharacterized protein (DUF1778 family)